jgi:hypothetical protein
MTPTLRGRWQTRTFLMVVCGIPLTLPFCLLAFVANPFSAPFPLFMLAVVWGVGMALDPIYQRRTRKRWDHDWPVHLQFLAGILEGGLSFAVLFAPCGGVALVNPAFLILFPIHYLLVWGVNLLMAQGPIRVLFPQWRYRGGEIWGVRTAE